MAYMAGDSVKTRIKFEVDDELTDPTNWSVFLQPPNEQAKKELVFGVDGELARTVGGDPAGDFTWTQPTSYTSGLDHGLWIFDVVSTGDAAGARPGSFPVDEPTVGA